jgi:Domain of unknown function (DUF4062)
LTHGPNLFISSTCYDLRQVRADLEEFARSLGLNPILSEFSSFPVDPHLGTIDNCLTAVDRDADLFLLIIGNRYGQLATGSKSVTNLEYLRARAKGIPIYVFVLRAILTALPIWKKNPEADFGTVVDSPQLFEFVETISVSDNLWVFPFDLAQEIKSTLRSQLGVLFLESLNVRRRLRSSPLPESVSNLKGNALRVAVDRQLQWDYSLFAAVITDGIAASRPLKLDRDNRLRFGAPGHIEGPAILAWLREKKSEIEVMSADLENLFEVALLDALGEESASSSDPEKIIYIARKIVEIYRASMIWSIDCYKISVDPVARKCVDLAANYISGFTEAIESVPGVVEAEVDRVKSLSEQGTDRIESLLYFKVSMPEMKDFHEEYERLARAYAEK